MSYQKAVFSSKTGSLSRGERAGVRGEHYRGLSRVDSRRRDFFLNATIARRRHFRKKLAPSPVGRGLG